MGRRDITRIDGCRGRDKSTTPAAADLTTFASGRARFVRRPFVRGPFFVCSAAALAGDFTLLVNRHRSESSAFLAYSVHGSASCLSKAPEPLNRRATERADFKRYAEPSNM